ncbi:hypothetical protein ABZV93_24145 [Actinopolymorpha sp. NPDC004070]|uniref:alpha/beta hydrolase family protein n=1 Tax=Actinopolymorpha sp. NPDC004070 TaxID=3154548 RepID=UPI0033AC2267
MSISGNHNWRHYIPAWSHLYLGTVARWADVDNTQVAAGLRGRLLLVHGELDDNALPSQMLRVVDALIPELDSDLAESEQWPEKNRLPPFSALPETFGSTSPL